MGDTSIEKVKLFAVNSKYLSPCRTFGLKRKSASPNISDNKFRKGSNLAADRKCATPVTLKNLKKTSKKELESPSKNYELLDVESTQPIVLMEKLNLEKVFLEKTYNMKLSPVVRLKRLNITRRKESTKLPDEMKDDTVGIIERINSKITRLEDLKRLQLYTKKHDLVKLKESTEKWKSACRDILFHILDILKSNGRDVSVIDFLTEHNIPCELIGYNEETMQFE